MPDLRVLLEDAVARRVVPTPPVATVTEHAELLRVRHARRQLVGLAVAVVVLFVATSVTWAVRNGDDRRTYVAARPGSPSTTTVPTSSTAVPTPGRAGNRSTSPTQADGGVDLSTPPKGTDDGPKGPECKVGANGGATDVGVTGNRIHIGMTNTRSGTNSSIVGSAHVAMQAVANRVNRAGGICGRLLDVRAVDDPSGPSQWPRFAGHMFAELVGPLQPGFDAHLAEGAVDRAGVPVVGTDGWSARQFRSPWVWPVGTPVASLARIAVDHAYRSLGARTFALVHDGTSDFGTAAPAVRQYVPTLPGASLRVVHSVGERTDEFDRACDNQACDVVVLATTPRRATEWLGSGAARGRLQTVLLRFLPGFENGCSLTHRRTPTDPCPAVDVWTGYTPPVGPFLQDPDVARYHEEMTEIDEDVDDVNAFVEGTYVGMQVLVEALKRTGPTLTRERLREVLDSMRFESGLVGTLSWRANRVGHASARLLRIGEAVEDAGTGWVRDPTPGVFPE